MGGKNTTASVRRREHTYGYSKRELRFVDAWVACTIANASVAGNRSIPAGPAAHPQSARRAHQHQGSKDLRLVRTLHQSRFSNTPTTHHQSGCG